MIYELKYLLKILFPKRLRLFVFLISFDKELNTFTLRQAKALWPLGQPEVVLLPGVSLVNVRTV